MKLKSKILLFSTVWLVVMLLLVNGAIYVLFQKNILDNDLNRIKDHAESVAGASLKLLARNEENEDIDNQETEQPDAEEPKHEESAPSMLTKEQAIEIALKEVPGKVDDIELDEKNGIKVYEVEIEVDDDTEATIIINAYTGKIISLTWD